MFLLTSKDREAIVKTALETLGATPQMLENVGFEKLVFEDFYEVLEGLVKNIVKPDDVFKKILDEESLLNAFQDDTVSNSIVMYLRMLTSAQLRLDPDSYAPFLFHPETGEPMEVREFCEHFVEATGKEAGKLRLPDPAPNKQTYSFGLDHVQMTALSRALHLNVDIAYLDGRGADGQVEFVKFQNETDTKIAPICLLYRPGHYDLLIQKNQAFD
ncbi:hypothetical protein V5O48_002611 [Marasmius crinis-equi]|uniref:ubiquitinyl hydrolase 1 n=1 Tax=Marasmius crinis-equi TaxID=585013 RepID=A0ABR3FV62_9AGAR